MAVSLELRGAQELAARLRRAPELLAQEQARAMERSLLLVEAEARRRAPHDTRQLLNSISHRQYHRGRSLVGQVGPSVRYGVVVERGRTPGRPAPPRQALRGWARRHGIPDSALYVLARAIGRRGIKARPYMVPAWLANADRVQRLFAAAGAAVVARLAGPGAQG